MFLFKRKRNNKTSINWYCRFNDHLNIQRQVQLFKDKRASEEAARKIERLCDFRRAKQSIDSELLRFIEELSYNLKNKLAEWNILDQQQAQANLQLVVSRKIKSNNGKPRYNVIGGHLLNYKNYAKSKENSAKHINQVLRHCRQIFTDCRFIYPSDISSHKFQEYISKLRQNKLAARTVNSYIADFKTFCNWLVFNSTLTTNPITNISAYNIAADRRHVRRSLTETEINQLITVTAQSNKHHGLSGAERSLLYRLALETGLRWGEIYSLQRKDFLLDDQSCIIAPAGITKNGKEAQLPLRNNIKNDLKDYFREKPALPAAKVFQNMWKGRGAEMLYEDLENAGIERETGQGIIDFHSLRHTFGTRLAKSGAAPKVAMDLMRHSDINLTMNVYSHTLLEDRASALNKTPEIISAKTELSQTGTAGRDIRNNVDTETDTDLVHFKGISSPFEAHIPPKKQPLKAIKKEGELFNIKEVTPSIFLEPPIRIERMTCGLQNRCSTS